MLSGGDVDFGVGMQGDIGEAQGTAQKSQA
jgi:hypothetical protein